MTTAAEAITPLDIISSERLVTLLQLQVLEPLALGSIRKRKSPVC